MGRLAWGAGLPFLPQQVWWWVPVCRNQSVALLCENIQIGVSPAQYVERTDHLCHPAQWARSSSKMAASSFLKSTSCSRYDSIRGASVVSSIIIVRPYLIDFMFHGFPSKNYDPGGRLKKARISLKNINFLPRAKLHHDDANRCSYACAGARPFFFSNKKLDPPDP